MPVTPTPTVEIARNKKNLSWFLTGGLILFFFGLLLLVYPTPFISLVPHQINAAFIIEAVGVSVMVIGGIYSYIMAVRIASVFPAMIISDKDIYDHTGTPGDGLINWEDISGFRESLIRGHRFITVLVKHPQVYIDRQRNPVKKRLLARLNSDFGSPIQIPAEALAYDLRSLMILLEARLDSYRASVLRS
ncbi:MAG TPA: STM3941 family protein [Dinghuibacter sp.]|uniref:STM3941 family protein n=1 Tax=Dinghuibacter sp. TaxID=2024697 RepID=UPI002C2E0731|nr:STM3941 family protein [Dinghuibacter sp.]HTJ11230.1 STM3941 family protein [Dinghuibacter sp.]